MKKFKFQLESVRVERERFENLRLREWSIVNKMFRDLIDEKLGLEKKLQSSIHEMTALNQAAQLTTAPLIDLDHYIQGLKSRIEWKQMEIIRAEKFVERKRVEWMGARQKRKILDTLKDKQHEIYKEEVKVKENRLVDDLYIMRAVNPKKVAQED